MDIRFRLASMAKSALIAYGPDVNSIAVDEKLHSTYDAIAKAVHSSADYLMRLNEDKTTNLKIGRAIKVRAIIKKSIVSVEELTQERTARTCNKKDVTTYAAKFMYCIEVIKLKEKS